MFTGLVESVSPIVRLELPKPRGRLNSSIAVLRLGIRKPQRFSVQKGDSVAVEGCCLTVAKVNTKEIFFDLSAETQKLTRFHSLCVGQFVNLERALTLGSRLGGHFVTGHVDGLGRVEANSGIQKDWELRISIDSVLARHCVLKGSMCINGVSLTINELIDQSKSSLIRFTLIPETLKTTTLKFLKKGDSVHVEVDLLSKFVERQMGRPRRP